MNNVKRKRTFYELVLKRPIDLIISFLGLMVLSPVFLIISILVKIKLGGPVIFKQKRPGKDEKILTVYKFRSMTNEKDENGNYLPDEKRLTKFGKVLRSTSLDELPSLINILKGDMSIIGPRPQLVENMFFMSAKERTRHLVRPGLTGLAQVNGRNAIAWPERLAYDVEYIEKITLWQDIKIFIKTIFIVLKREGVSAPGMETAQNLGDYLLEGGQITKDEYNETILKIKHFTD